MEEAATREERQHRQVQREIREAEMLLSMLTATTRL
jgi:hypothetical protein